MHTIQTKSLKSFENHDYVEMPEEDNKILKYTHGEKSMRAESIAHADLDLLLQKMNTSHNNPEK